MQKGFGVDPEEWSDSGLTNESACACWKVVSVPVNVSLIKREVDETKLRAAKNHDTPTLARDFFGLMRSVKLLNRDWCFFLAGGTEAARSKCEMVSDPPVVTEFLC